MYCSVKKRREWPGDLPLDIHVGRITWEEIEPNFNGSCAIPMTWKLKPDKPDPVCERQFEKSFLSEADCNEISARLVVCIMLQKRDTAGGWGCFRFSHFSNWKRARN